MMSYFDNSFSVSVPWKFMLIHDYELCLSYDSGEFIFDMIAECYTNFVKTFLCI